ncbi:hypothetical protein WJX74_007109 [Apatococcus lobatus]|uniref:Uncharacterized protein n=1 Tax=Apatococcus lobatus TaxID=904363 RepID=A0AAW1S751_9CHLO
MIPAEGPQRVVVEFLPSSGGFGKRGIRLTHTAQSIPPQLQGRMDPGTWAGFMNEAQALSQRHPYLQHTSGGQKSSWLLCGLPFICVGLFPSYPQGGNEQAWAQEAAGLVQRWQPRFGTVGLSLSLQHARSWWLQIDAAGHQQGYAPY